MALAEYSQTETASNTILPPWTRIHRLVPLVAVVHRLVPHAQHILVDLPLERELVVFVAADAVKVAEYTIDTAAARVATVVVVGMVVEGFVRTL